MQAVFMSDVINCDRKDAFRTQLEQEKEIPDIPEIFRVSSMNFDSVHAQIFQV